MAGRFNLCKRSSKLHSIFLEHADNFVNRDGAAVINIGTFKDIYGLCFSYCGAGSSEEVKVPFKGKLFIFIHKAIHAQIFFKFNSIETEDYSQFCHDALHLILKLFIFVSHAHELTVENGMHEHLVPRESVFLVYLECAFEKADSGCRKVLATNHQRLAFDICCKLILSISFPRGFSMQHFIENETQRPYIAFTCVLLGLQDLNRHVERCAHRGSHFLVQTIWHLLMLLRKTEIS